MFNALRSRDEEHIVHGACLQLSRFGRAVQNRPFGGTGSANFENADKEGAVDELKAARWRCLTG
jgi:hypothetical protein